MLNTDGCDLGAAAATASATEAAAASATAAANAGSGAEEDAAVDAEEEVGTAGVRGGASGVGVKLAALAKVSAISHLKLDFGSRQYNMKMRMRAPMAHIRRSPPSPPSAKLVARA